MVAIQTIDFDDRTDDGLRDVQLLPLEIFILCIFIVPVIVWAADFCLRVKTVCSGGMQ